MLGRLACGVARCVSDVSSRRRLDLNRRPSSQCRQLRTAGCSLDQLRMQMAHDGVDRSATDPIIPKTLEPRLQASQQQEITDAEGSVALCQ